MSGPTSVWYNPAAAAVLTGEAGPASITNAGAIAAAEAFGSASIQPRVDPAALASSEAIGAPVVSIAHAITGAGAIASVEATGSPALTLTVEPAALASSEAIGAPSTRLTVAPGAIVSAEQVGVPSAQPRLAPGAIAGAEAFGSPTLSDPNAPYSITAAGGFYDKETFGTPSVSVQSAASGGAKRPRFQWLDSPPWPARPQYLLDINLKDAGDIISEERFGVPRISFVRDPGTRRSEEELWRLAA